MWTVVVIIVVIALFYAGYRLIDFLMKEMVNDSQIEID
jgi:hypothetical protein